MPTINKKALVPYTDLQMFALVDGIAQYPEFLPWCRSSAVHKREGDIVEASIEIESMGFQKAFTTRNTLTPHNQITLSLVDGPFEALEGLWSFKAVGEGGCEVSLHIDYSFAGGWAALAFGAVFSKVANSLVDAFCARAKEVYGKA